MTRSFLARPPRALLVAAAASLAFGAARALASSGGHSDPVAGVAIWLAVILAAAKLGGDLAVRLGQPAVLGELLGGVLLGNLPLAGITLFEPLKTDPFIDMLSRIGVLVLLFEVGLESTVGQMLRVGAAASLVAVVGVVAPFLLGWGVGAWLLPEHSAYAHAFLGAALCATSVGITARVLKDLGQSRSAEARVILGAAVIDDVLGLMILAVVSGLIAAANTGTTLSTVAILGMFAKAVAFLGGSLFLGTRLSPRIFSWAASLRSKGVLIAVGLSFCFVLSWLSDLIGLAPIVGAFAAGLILENTHYAKFVERGDGDLETLIHPISMAFVPVFFVLMGARTDLAAFAMPGVLGLAAALTLAAILGKQVCGLVLPSSINRLAVGVGMVPRGEVGLIFANIGFALTLKDERVIGPPEYAAVVVMVMVTTAFTPPALEWALKRSTQARPAG